jgi:deoxyxylulose-5-phosphate synthase
VNDNGRSYAPTIGGLAKYLNDFRTESFYKRMYRASKKFFSMFGPLGRLAYSTIRGAGKGLLGTFTPKSMFPNLDLKYIGPIDGHDQEAMEQALRQAKQYGAPVIVHAITQKGRGFSLAEDDVNDQYHAVGQIDPKTGKSLESSSGSHGHLYLLMKFWRLLVRMSVLLELPEQCLFQLDFTSLLRNSQTEYSTSVLLNSMRLPLVLD